MLGLSFSSAASAAPNQCGKDLALAEQKLTLAKSDLNRAERTQANCAKKPKSCEGWKESPALLTKQAADKVKTADRAYYEAKRKCSASAPAPKKPGQDAPVERIGGFL